VRGLAPKVASGAEAGVTGERAERWGEGTSCALELLVCLHNGMSGVRSRRSVKGSGGLYRVAHALRNTIIGFVDSLLEGGCEDRGSQASGTEARI
jgi:hypothetical protein